MGQIVLTLSAEKVEEMKQTYQSMLKTAPQGAIFSATTSNITITAYKSGKVLFQGSNPEIEAKKWGTVEEATKEPKKKPTHGFEPYPGLFNQSHIGSDEAGTGDYFGPVTVAAVYVKAEQMNMLQELGVKDSKNLTDSTIQTIAKKLLQLKIPYSLVILHNEKYNQLQKRGWTQGKIKTMLHHQAITKVLQKIAPKEPMGILIDQFSQPSVYQKHLRSEDAKLQKNVHFMTKAESHSIAVAAGSIIARASFVQEMNKLSTKAGVTLPKGASAKVDRVAGKILDRGGIEELEKYSKIHFANTKKAESYL
ncbi:ribonuclease HIII [Paraliobacillus quinghaiensis]|uniref:Ribonuclease HIII n=1 Tax=Paraliobacillus quinghaiensis TaxID=470815 RepID=A0A917TLG8_9BACI|nr:ribonuclease HIII [Paraliobacillus quinghaiensis]GGM26955.1 ribonuclease HIII [Paraliobacillus quinghaiensis]